MDTYEFMLRKLQRKEAKQKSEAARRQRQLEESEALLRPHSRPLRFNQAESSTEEEQESAPNHSVPAPRRTQENSRAVARQTGESFPSTVNKNAGQAGKSYSPSAAFHVSCSNSPASSTARANQRLTEDSSDDDDMDLVEVFKARELASIRSTVISSTPPRPTLMDRRIDDSLGSESVHKRKSPRNPFTLSTFHAAKQPPRDVAIKSTNNESDDLWSDSDNNEEPTKKAKTERVPKSLKLLQSRKKRPNEEAERGLNRILPSMKNLEQSLQDITEDEDFNVDLTELKPVFDFPRFGPLDFEPFVLNPGHLGIESPICVPASISRYLPLYQKEGIQFMYNQAVTSGHGAVLGDGEFRSFRYILSLVFGSVIQLIDFFCFF